MINLLLVIIITAMLIALGLMIYKLGYENGYLQGYIEASDYCIALLEGRCKNVQAKTYETE